MTVACIRKIELVRSGASARLTPQGLVTAGAFLEVCGRSAVVGREDDDGVVEHLSLV